MKLTKINSYVKLDAAVIDILKKENKILTAHAIESILLENYEVVNVRVNPKKIAMRIRQQPNVRVYPGARMNRYGVF